MVKGKKGTNSPGVCLLWYAWGVLDSGEQLRRFQIWIIDLSVCKHCGAFGSLDLGENVLLGRFLL